MQLILFLSLIITNIYGLTVPEFSANLTRNVIGRFNVALKKIPQASEVVQLKKGIRLFAVEFKSTVTETLETILEVYEKDMKEKKTEDNVSTKTSIEILKFLEIEYFFVILKSFHPELAKSPKTAKL